MSVQAVRVALYRLDPAVDLHRQIVHRTANLARTGFTDTEVRAGHRYAYAVRVFDASGAVVGASRTRWVSVPRVADFEIEALRLRCALGDAVRTIGCEWGRPTSRAAAVVSLWRSVDGGPRQLVERFRPLGSNAYRDRVPDGASTVTYWVIATSESGAIVGRSRRSSVRIPGDFPPVAVRQAEHRLVEVVSP